MKSQHNKPLNFLKNRLLSCPVFRSVNQSHKLTLNYIASNNNILLLAKLGIKSTSPTLKKLLTLGL